MTALDVAVEARPARTPVSAKTPVGYIAAEVRAACSRKGVRQGMLAKVFGVSRATITRRWMGDIPWDGAELVTISVMTDTPASAFMPPLDFGPDGAVAQLAELRTFNPKSGSHLHLVASNLAPEPSTPSATPRLLEVPASPIRLIR